MSPEFTKNYRDLNHFRATIDIFQGRIPQLEMTTLQSKSSAYLSILQTINLCVLETSKNWVKYS